MEIIVLGTGCPQQKTTYDSVAKVIAETNNSAICFNKSESDISNLFYVIHFPYKNLTLLANWRK